MKEAATEGLSGMSVARCRQLLGWTIARPDRGFRLCDVGATGADENMHDDRRVY